MTQVGFFFLFLPFLSVKTYFPAVSMSPVMLPMYRSYGEVFPDECSCRCQHIHILFLWILSLLCIKENAVQSKINSLFHGSAHKARFQVIGVVFCFCAIYKLCISGCRRKYSLTKGTTTVVFWWCCLGFSCSFLRLEVERFSVRFQLFQCKLCAILYEVFRNLQPLVFKATSEGAI